MFLCLSTSATRFFVFFLDLYMFSCYRSAEREAREIIQNRLTPKPTNGFHPEKFKGDDKMRISEYLQIGNKMKAARKKQRFTQRQMAKELELGFSTYSNYENGYSEPPMEVIRRFCRILNISEHELFEFKLDAPQKTSICTFSDLLSILIDLDRRGLPIKGTTTYSQKDNQLYAHLTLDIKNAQIATFIPDWNEVNEKVTSGLMDEEEYQMWLEDTLKIFDVPIEEYI